MSSQDAANGDALAALARPSVERPVVTTVPGTPGVYVLHEAYRAIHEHIGWGRRTATNVVEQAGLLVGHRYRDSASGEAFAIVESVLEAQFGESSSGAITLTHATWFDLLNRLDALPVPEGKTAWQIIGWYHTHPNSLPVFMSGTDRRTQRDLFDGPQYFAFVLNPHRGLWAAFQGADCVECCAIAFETPGVPPVPEPAAPSRTVAASSAASTPAVAAPGVALSLDETAVEVPPAADAPAVESPSGAGEPAAPAKSRKRRWPLGNWFDKRA